MWPGHSPVAESDLNKVLHDIVSKAVAAHEYDLIKMSPSADGIERVTEFVIIRNFDITVMLCKVCRFNTEALGSRSRLCHLIELLDRQVDFKLTQSMGTTGLKRMYYNYEAQKIKGLVSHAYRVCSRSATARNNKIKDLKKLFCKLCMHGAADAPAGILKLAPCVPLGESSASSATVSWADPVAKAAQGQPDTGCDDDNCDDAISVSSRSDGCDDEAMLAALSEPECADTELVLSDSDLEPLEEVLEPLEEILEPLDMEALFDFSQKPGLDFSQKPGGGHSVILDEPQVAKYVDSLCDPELMGSLCDALEAAPARSSTSALPCPSMLDKASKAPPVEHKKQKKETKRAKKKTEKTTKKSETTKKTKKTTEKKKKNEKMFRLRGKRPVGGALLATDRMDFLPKGAVLRLRKCLERGLRFTQVRIDDKKTLLQITSKSVGGDENRAYAAAEFLGAMFQSGFALTEVLQAKKDLLKGQPVYINGEGVTLESLYDAAD